MGFKIDVEWPGSGKDSLELGGVSRAQPQMVGADGSISADLGPDESAYLSHGLPRTLKERPDDALPVPPHPAELYLSCDFEGRGPALWLLQFRGSEHLASDRWLLKERDTIVQWTPADGADGVRVALRMAGRTRVKSLELRLPQATGARRPGTQTEWRRLWTLLNLPRAEPPETVDNVLSARLVPESTITPLPERIVLEPGSVAGPDARRRLAELGVNADWLDFDSDLGITGISPKLIHAIEHGTYRRLCPFSGGTIHSRDTFLVCPSFGRPYVFVRFEGSGKVFYEIFDCYGGKVSGLYFPADNFIMYNVGNIPRAVKCLQFLFLRNAHHVREYLTSDRERTICIPVNTTAHFGHWILNEVEALSTIIREGTGKGRITWLDCGLSFMDAEGIFPGLKIDKARFGMNDIFLTCLADDRLVVMPRMRKYYLGEEALKSIVDLVRRREEKTGYGSLIDRKLAGKWPVVWVEWRANDRIWTNEKEALALLVQRLKADYPDFAVMVAGWSRMNAERSEDEAMIGLEEEQFGDLREALDTQSLHFVSGETILNKLAWTGKADCYLAINGSGLMFPLIMGLPGVIVANRFYVLDARKGGARRPDAPDFVHGQPPLEYVPEALIADEEGSRGPGLTNFRVDPEGLARFFEEKVLRRLVRPAGR